MKTPFLFLAALTLTISTQSFAAPLTADQERQEKADEAQFRLAEFNKFHPDRNKWTAQDKERFADLEKNAQEAPPLPNQAADTKDHLEHASQEAPLAPLHPLMHAASRALPPPHAAKVATGPQKDDMQARLAKAWTHIQNAAGGIRDGIAGAFETIRDGAQDVAFEGENATRHILHDRPLLFSNYVDVVKKGNEVSLVYCDSRLFRLNPAGGQHCEKLHKGSFTVAELRSCLNSAQDNKQPGMILNRQLDSMQASDREFSAEHFKMYDTKENYAEYLNSCHARIAARQPKPRAVVKAAPQIPALPRTPASPPPALAPAPADELPKLDLPPMNQGDTQAAPAPVTEGTL